MRLDFDILAASVSDQVVVPAADTPRPLRVALFSGNYNYLRDGANQALNRLVRHAQQRVGAQVRVYSPTTATPAFAPAGELVSVPSIAIPGRSEFRFALGMPRRIRADLDRFTPDLVHLSAPDALGNAALNWARARGIPTVASVHTRFETYFAYYGLGWIRSRIERYLDSFYGRSDLVLAPTPPLRAEFAATHGEAHVRLWSRGVEHQNFSPERRDHAWRQRLGYADGEAVVLYLGRLVREKGTELFVDVMRRLETEGCAIRPLIVGEGPERPRLAAALPRAMFTGHLDGPDLWRAVASSDILLMPSRTEAFGNVVLEAMAAGLAVVSADVASARQIATDQVDALLCPPGDAAAYGDAVRNLIEDRDLRLRIATAARRASMAFRWDETLDSVLEAWRDAILRGPAPIRRTPDEPSRTAMLAAKSLQRN
jgi:glycosyltransferase involved in cell wall biosynthesis